MKLKTNVKYIVQAGIIAAIYAVLTIILAPISYGPMQVRVSEALTILPVFTSASIPGLFVGCVIANVFGGNGVIDVVFGSLATVVAAFITYKLRNKPLLAPLAPVVLNGGVVGSVLYFAYGVPMSLFACMGWVAIGELIACYAIGYPLMKLLGKYEAFLK
ncbi:MAG: QueT transporter family protein [Anaerovoracaceae bacterium]